MTDDVSLVDDITQDALLLVLLRIRGKRIEHPERISSYVAQTAKYTLIGWYRRKANQHGSAIDVSEIESSDAGLEDALIAVEQQSLVRSMITQLKVPRDQEILKRSYLFEEDKPSLCKHLDLPGQHFDRVISRARARFKKIIKAQKSETQLAMQIV
jgi:RNA polymerase sigma factor (sigma-70 family)